MLWILIIIGGALLTALYFWDRKEQEKEGWSPEEIRRLRRHIGMQGNKQKRERGEDDA